MPNHPPAGRPAIYLDHAATSLHKPPCVAEAVCEAFSSIGNSERGAHEMSLQASRVVFRARQKICAMFGAGSPSGVVFTANATESLNIAIQGLVGPKDHAVTTVLEHNSVLRPLYLQESRGAALSFAGCDAAGRVNPREIESLIRPGTRAVVCSHGSNVTGNVTDIRAIGEICRRRGALFIVDASQSAGLLPIDMREDHIDVLCFSGHKGLLGPQGTGCLLVREGLSIPPLLVGGSGIQSFSKTHPADMPTALEAGTLNGHGIAGLLAAIGYLEEYGIARIYGEALRLALQFAKGVKSIPRVTLYGDFSMPGRLPIVSLNIGSLDSGEVSDELAQSFGILTRAGAHCAPLMHRALGTESQGMVRFSFSHFNKEAEIRAAVEAVREIAAR